MFYEKDLNSMPPTSLTTDPVEQQLKAAQSIAPVEGRPSWQQRRDQLRERVHQRPPVGITTREMDIHFAAMPGHYWQGMNEADLLWGLETIHGFLRLLASPEVPPTAPFVDWRLIGDSRCARVMLCTWDRHGLLAKAAAAFAAVRLNILQAKVFTRDDNLVLDEFAVTDAEGRGTVAISRLEEMAFLVDGALSEPPRFASIWACSRHKLLAPRTTVAPRIRCDNNDSPVATVVRVEAADRLGLLYDILEALADAGLDIKQATIETTSGWARDQILVTDERGQKLVEPARLEALCARLAAAVTLRD
jgi:UTP:GlnB (protein PII) uridylyltransferase